MDHSSIAELDYTRGSQFHVEHWMCLYEKESRLNRVTVESLVIESLFLAVVDLFSVTPISLNFGGVIIMTI